MSSARLLVLALAVWPVPALADPPTRESQLVIYGEDACPRGEDGEVVVCARRPESERYRIPRPIRERQPLERSWASRVEGLDAESRPGRPDSCSVVGSFGQGGCLAMQLQRWRAERRAQREEDAGIP